MELIEETGEKKVGLTREISKEEAELTGEMGKRRQGFKRNRKEGSSDNKRSR